LEGTLKQNSKSIRFRMGDKEASEHKLALSSVVLNNYLGDKNGR
jgi:hypothetical protein